MKLFISHSSKTDNARALRDAVARHLEAQDGIDVLWDSDIHPGNRWRAKLDNWLAEADGGVILFSRDAVDSAWVLKEAQILTWRKAVVGDPFVLIPVLLAGVERKETGMGDWTPVKIDEIQFAEGGDPETMTPADRAALATAIEQKIPVARRGKGIPARDDPLRQWFKLLERELKKADEDALKDAALGLGFDETDPDWPPDGDKAGFARILARRFLHFGSHPPVVLEQEDFERACDEVQSAFYDFTAEKRRAIADLFFPTWVHPDSVREILRERAGDEDAVLCINAFDPRTGNQYVHRATCGESTFRRAVLSVPDVHDGDLSGIVRRYRDKLIDRFGLAGTWKADEHGAWKPEDRKSWVKAVAGVMQDYHRVFVVLYDRACHPDVLRPLREDFAPFTFVLLVSAGDPAALGFTGCRILEPLVPAGREQRVLSRYNELVGEGF